MTTTTKVATAERILAIDLGKYKSVVCDYRHSSGEVAFATIKTTRYELSKQLGKRRPSHAWEMSAGLVSARSWAC